MTTLQIAEVLCSNCGRKSRHRTLSSTNQFGTVDLDMRPPEMARSTMDTWMQQCPGCGLVALDLSDKWEGDPDWLKSAGYLEAKSRLGIPPLARTFLCKAFLDSKENDHFGAFRQTLWAAWVLDDEKLEVEAREVRLEAARWLEDQTDLNPNTQATLLDVLRRAQAWDKARRVGEDLQAQTLDAVLAAVVAYQLGRIEQRDDGVHTVDEAYGRPPKRPIAVSRPPKPPAKRWWGLRLFGRRDA